MQVNLHIELPSDMRNGDIMDMATALTGAGFEVELSPSIYHIEYLQLRQSNDYPNRGYYLVPKKKAK